MCFPLLRAEQLALEMKAWTLCLIVLVGLTRARQEIDDQTNAEASIDNCLQLSDQGNVDACEALSQKAAQLSEEISNEVSVALATQAYYVSG